MTRCPTSKLTGGNGAQRKCRPVRRLVGLFLRLEMSPTDTSQQSNCKY
jgi:hypothetical protein